MAGTIRLCIETVVGRKVSVNVQPNMIIRDIKRIASRHFNNIDPEQQSLVKCTPDGHFLSLDNSKSAAECTLREDDRLLLVPIMRAGQDTSVKVFLTHQDRFDAMIERMLLENGRERDPTREYILLGSKVDGDYVIIELPLSDREISDISAKTASAPKELVPPTAKEIAQNEKTRAKAQALKQFLLHGKKSLISAGQDGRSITKVEQQSPTLMPQGSKSSCEAMPPLIPSTDVSRDNLNSKQHLQKKDVSKMTRFKSKLSKPECGTTQTAKRKK